MITTDDLLFAFQNKLACRHVSDADVFRKNLSSDVQGDAYAIGAVNMLTFTKEQRAHEGRLHDALMQRIVASFSGGPKEADVIRAGGEQLVESYRSELKRMVAAAVDYDDRHGNAADCHFIVYKDISGVASPYDTAKYPFGKCGKDTLPHSKVIAGVFLEDDEKEALRGNTGAIADRLTEKLFSALSKARTRSEESLGAGGEIFRGGATTKPQPSDGGWADNV